MKLAYVISQAFQIQGGALLGARASLSSLQRTYGFECVLYSQHPVTIDECIDGIRHHSFPDVTRLDQLIRAYQPDLIIGSLNDALPAFRVAERYQVPRILCVHSHEICPPSPEEIKDWLLPEATQALSEATLSWILAQVDRLVCYSDYMQHRIQQQRNLPADRLTYEWDVPRTLMQVDDHQPQKITAVCGFRHKGIELFIDLARRHPKSLLSWQENSAPILAVPTWIRYRPCPISNVQGA